MALAQKKQEIDLKAHKQMRVVLWFGLVALTLQVLVFFRLTFWELSWDIMEPIAFFATAGGLICGYTYFLVTSRDPSYQDFMQRLYHSRQRKLFRKQNFDIKRFKELQVQCQTKPPTKQLLEDCDWIWRWSLKMGSLLYSVHIYLHQIIWSEFVSSHHSGPEPSLGLAGKWEGQRSLNKTIIASTHSSHLWR